MHRPAFSPRITSGSRSNTGISTPATGLRHAHDAQHADLGCDIPVWRLALPGTSLSRHHDLGTGDQAGHGPVFRQHWVGLLVEQSPCVRSQQSAVRRRLPKRLAASVCGSATATSCYIDDLIIEPAVPSIDNPTFSLTGSGSTQQLTAGGFTDPLYGVTWSSSNTAVATVNRAGLVTAVAAGTATITATGKRDSGQTATATATVTTTSATSYTLTTPTPCSGCANNPSGNFTVTPNGSYTGSITITPSGGGLSRPITLNWTASSTPQTFTITPTAAGQSLLTPTNSGTLS